MGVFNSLSNDWGNNCYVIISQCNISKELKNSFSGDYLLKGSWHCTNDTGQ